jgi:hypothetical protein
MAADALKPYLHFESFIGAASALVYHEAMARWSSTLCRREEFRRPKSTSSNLRTRKQADIQPVSSLPWCKRPFNGEDEASKKRLQQSPIMHVVPAQMKSFARRNRLTSHGTSQIATGAAPNLMRNQNITCENSILRRMQTASACHSV